MGVFLQSPGKLNLGLRVVGRRANGYHDLQSVFWPISLCDEITIERRDLHCSHKVSVTGRFSIDEETNLVTKLLAKLPEISPLEITIRKSIPLGGGLGGGSSNVGTVLRYLVDDGQITLSRARLIAEEMGADVPFFLNPTPSWVTGLGENCHPLDITEPVRKNLSFLIIPLSTPTSTLSVFGRYRLEGTHSPELASPPQAFDSESLVEFLRSAKNDLEPFALQETPAIRPVAQWLRDLNSLYAGVSGSGSSCFAIFSSLRDAENALELARLAHFDDAMIHQTFCPTLSR